MVVSKYKLNELEAINSKDPKKLVRLDNHTDIFLKKFSVVIPAYNEENRIGPVLREVCETIVERSLPWEVIVSIDGNDRTDALVREMMSSYKFLNFIKGSGRSGKGGAIKRTISSTLGEYLILMDADFSLSFKEMVSKIPLLRGNDVVIFSRYYGGNKIPLSRRVLSRSFNVMTRAITGLRVSDTQSGYKMFRSEIFKKAMNKVTVTNAVFDVPLLYYIKKMGGNIIEVPGKYVHSDHGKLKPLHMTLSFSVSLLAFRVRNSPLNKYVPKGIRELYYKKFRWI